MVTGNCRQTASAVMKDEDGNILKDPRAAHLSSASSLWLQYLFFTYSSGNFHPSVSHWTSFSTNQIICGCRKRLWLRQGHLKSPIHNFFYKIVKSLWTAINVVWSFIHTGQSQTSILFRRLYLKLLNAVVCYVRMVYLRLILTLTWHCMLGLRRGRNVVPI